ncbi:uncharacterized protein AB9W97_000363 isoform 1-T1 [Spinachia spinachia]
MSKGQMLRCLVKQRLTEAAEEIFGLFERTIAEYEEEASRFKEDNERLKKRLHAVFHPEVRIQRADLQQLFLPKEKQQEGPHVKEEEEDPQLQRLEEADIMVSFTPLKSEDDEVESSQLNRRQTQEAEGDGDDFLLTDRNSGPSEPDTDEKIEDSTETEMLSENERIESAERGETDTIGTLVDVPTQTCPQLGRLNRIEKITHSTLCARTLIMEKKRRNAYDAAFKLNAIRLSVKEGNRVAANMLGISESMVRRWRGQQEELTRCKKTTKAFRGNKSRWPELENVLEDWVNTQRADGRSVSSVQIRLKAKTMAAEKKIDDFRGGPSWCFRFMQRKGLSVRPRTTV